MKMEQTVCSETLAHKIQTPENYPEESKQRSEHGGSLKSRTKIGFYKFLGLCNYNLCNRSTIAVLLVP